MNPDDYLKLYPTQGYGAEMATGHVHGVMLQFTEETAGRWGGPFEGGYCACVVYDYQNDPTFKHWMPLRTIAQHKEAKFKDYQKNVRKHAAYYTSKRSRKSAPKSPEDIKYIDVPTVESPIGVVCYGNDDTSYTKYVPTIEDAMELVALLEAGQPLDFEKDFLPLGFVFTN